MTDHASVLFLGESPPRGAPPDFRPLDCPTGTILARALGFTDRSVLLAHVPRDNCFSAPTGIGGDTPRWDDDAARQGAKVALDRLYDAAPGHRRLVVVALGQRPRDALDGDHMPPFTWEQRTEHDLVYVPHPSPRSGAYSSVLGQAEARRCLLPELVAGCPTLRPWHFRTDDPAVLADLSVAISPHRPALAAAAVILAAEVHKSAVDLGDIERRSTLVTRGRDAATVVSQIRERVAAVDCSLRRLATMANSSDAVDGIADLWRDAIKAKDLRARERWCERDSGLFDNYPPAARRSIYARHIMLGVSDASTEPVML